jgi:hypothetical protein
MFQERRMQKAMRVCAFALVVMCMGCGGETHRQLFKRYENQFAEKRQQFKNIAQMLPPPESRKGATAANLSTMPRATPTTPRS